MKYKISYLLLLSLFSFVVKADPANGVGQKGAPIDQYDYSLIIAAILIISISAIFIMRKKLNKA